MSDSHLLGLGSLYRYDKAFLIVLILELLLWVRQVQMFIARFLLRANRTYARDEANLHVYVQNERKYKVVLWNRRNWQSQQYLVHEAWGHWGSKLRTDCFDSSWHYGSNGCAFSFAQTIHGNLGVTRTLCQCDPQCLRSQTRLHRRKIRPFSLYQPRQSKKETHVYICRDLYKFVPFLSAYVRLSQFYLHQVKLSHFLFICVCLSRFYQRVYMCRIFIFHCAKLSQFKFHVYICHIFIFRL